MTAAVGYRLDITCCFCGGSLEVDEAGRTVRCPHCASVLRIAREGQIVKYRFEDRTPEREVRFLIEHHLKKAKEPLGRSWHDLSQVFLPFWRVTGMVLTIHRRSSEPASDIFEVHSEPHRDASPAEVALRHKDVTLCANELFPWGMESLGVRAQTAPLIPQEHDFHAAHRVLRLSVDSAQARQRFEQTVHSTAAAAAQPGSELHVHTASTECAVIYFPLWVGRFSSAAGPKLVQFDPLARRVVALTNGDSDLPAPDTSPGTAAIHVIPHRCPNCGADLPDRARAVAFLCPNCARLFVEDGRGYREHPVRVPGIPAPGQRLFPLWVFDLTRQSAENSAILAENLRSLGFPQDRFLVPAFEISNPMRLMRLVTHYNRRPELPRFETVPVQPEAFAEVAVSPATAASFVLPLTLAAKALRGLPAEEVPALSEADWGNPDLVWLPFVPERYFWQDPITGAAIERAAVRC